MLAEALENAFNPATSSNCIGIEPMLRIAAAWLPPGMAYAEPATEAETAVESAAAESGGDAADNPEPVDLGEGGESDEIPAFLTGDRSRPSRWCKFGVELRWPKVRPPWVEVLPDRHRSAAV